MLPLTLRHHQRVVAASSEAETMAIRVNGQRGVDREEESRHARGDGERGGVGRGVEPLATTQLAVHGTLAHERRDRGHRQRRADRLERTDEEHQVVVVDVGIDARGRPRRSRVRRGR